MRRYPVGCSARGGDDPLRHAATLSPASRTVHNVKAVCGTSIRPAGDWVNDQHRGQTFTGDNPRDCPRCASLLSELRRS